MFIGFVFFVLLKTYFLPENFQELAQWSSLAPVEGERLPFPVGSVAVRQARAAALRAQTAEHQLASALAERDALTRQVEELRPPELAQPESIAGQSATCCCSMILCLPSYFGIITIILWSLPFSATSAIATCIFTQQRSMLHPCIR